MTIGLTLYELTDAYRMLLEAAQTEADTPGNDEGDASTESPFSAALVQLEGSINDKAENVAAVIRTLDLEADAIEAEAKRLQLRATARRNRAAGLKAYLLDQLDKAGMAKAGGQRFTVTAQASPPSVKVADLALVPAAYLLPQPPKVDARGVLSYWKEHSDEAIPGVAVEQSRHVRIR